MSVDMQRATVKLEQNLKDRNTMLCVAVLVLCLITCLGPVKQPTYSPAQNAMSCLN